MPSERIFVELILALTMVGLIALWLKLVKAKKAHKEEAERILLDSKETIESLVKTIKLLEAQIEVRNRTIQLQKEQLATEARDRTILSQRVDALAKYEEIVDASARAQEILKEATDTLAQANKNAISLREQTNDETKARIEQADVRLSAASQEADQIIVRAEQRAEEIAGEAYAAMGRAKEYADTAQALKNLIEGYGDAYIAPTYSLLDDLAEEFGYDEAGKKLKEARDLIKAMARSGRAADCDYVEPSRRQTAIRFVTDAFNGKVDSILSRIKAENHGELGQKIKDAYALVNHNGAAFRNARITQEYLDARLNELKWGATAYALKEREREEQREIRERIREEERARREYERAINEAAKEEDAIKKAMEKVQRQVEAANEAQRAEYEAKLQDLQHKLIAAEEKNQRALSMAQQTRSGHVYVISNIGSFGEEVFKIGMTRRLEPTDRIRELGDASVPFEFDIHAMIYSDDAPGLEKTLHRHFLHHQMNKVNPRKEFFRLGLANIRQEIERLGINAHWTLVAHAHDYRETLKIEQQIRENPAIEHEWTRFQIENEPSIPDEENIPA